MKINKLCVESIDTYLKKFHGIKYMLIYFLLKKTEN